MGLPSADDDDSAPVAPPPPRPARTRRGSVFAKVRMGWVGAVDFGQVWSILVELDWSGAKQEGFFILSNTTSQWTPSFKHCWPSAEGMTMSFKPTQRDGLIKIRSENHRESFLYLMRDPKNYLVWTPN